jgi:putative heme-binding domain-containing protein
VDVIRCNITSVAVKVCVRLLLLHLISSESIRAQVDSSAGERLFHLHCAECHGLDGQGGYGPDLTRGEYRHGSSDEALFHTIATGVPGTRMPATSLSDRQLRQLVSYVRGLAGGARVAVAGDERAGEKLFRGKGICTKCHMIRGEGGSLGPDLTHIGSQRAPNHLRTSILQPDEEISPEFWAVDAIDKDGKTYSGIRLNEDTYTIQILDLSENLHSLNKVDLRSLAIKKNKSRMPAYEGVFTASELDDLVAYLYSLQKNPRGQ